MKLTTSILRIQATLLAVLMACGTACGEAVEFETLAPVQLNTTLTPTLTDASNLNTQWSSVNAQSSSANGQWSMVNGQLSPEPKYQLTWMRTNPGVQPYKFFDDVTFAGVPLFVAGIIAKGEKRSFRQNTGDNKHTLITKFKTRIDDYSQMAGLVAATGLKLAGVEGRSDWGRYLASTALSYAIMGGLVNGIKYTSKEMRPDGTTANSWPSGHTATAFMGATILHKEYGTTRSPWYSAAGYAVATATGVMRVLNNRHWVSDVLSGAGIGIMSTELAYGISDLLFKGKGLLRGDITAEKSIITNPSFFSVSMGLGWGTRKLNFDMEQFDFDGYEDGDTDFNLKFGSSTSVGVEGAYFFNKYIGVGGRLRVNSSPIKGWDGIEDYAWTSLIGGLYGGDMDNTEYEDFVYGQGTPGDPDYSAPIIDEVEFKIKSDHLTEFAGDVGLYFNLPLSSRFALGSKLLVGRSIMQEIDLDAVASGGERRFVYDTATDDFSLECLPSTYNAEWDYFTVGGNNTMKFGTGLSLTYAYKENYAWRLFLDYDYTRKTYTMTYNPGGFLDAALGLDGFVDPDDVTVETQKVKKHRNSFVIGGSFTISF